MDLLLNEQQLMLQSTVQDLLKRDFPKNLLAEFDAGRATLREHWNSVLSTGILTSLIPEEYGGVDGTFSDAGVIFQELGKGPLPGPHFSSSVLAVNIILECGSESQKKKYLQSIAEDKIIFAVAISEFNQFNDCTFTDFHLKNDKLSGSKLCIPDLGFATHILIPYSTDAHNQGLCVVPTTSNGVTIKHLKGMSTEQYALSIEDCVVEDALEYYEHSAFENAINKSTALLCSFQVGGLERVFEMSLNYSKTRYQFGQPIGRFQRVQDHIIDIVNFLDAAKWSTYEALWKIDSNQEFQIGVHMAASLSSEGYYLACNSAHDVHAGVGIIREYGLTLHTKMSRSLYSYLGNPRYHRYKIGQSLEL